MSLPSLFYPDYLTPKSSCGVEFATWRNLKPIGPTMLEIPMFYQILPELKQTQNSFAQLQMGSKVALQVCSQFCHLFFVISTLTKPQPLQFKGCIRFASFICFVLAANTWEMLLYQSCPQGLGPKKPCRSPPYSKARHCYVCSCRCFCYAVTEKSYNS